MHYEFTAIPDADVPQAVDPVFQHVVTTYASETNKTVSMWRAVPEEFLDFKPHEKTNTIRTIMVHQILSERRFFAQFVGTQDRLPRSCCLRVTNHSCKPTSTSMSGWRNSGCPSWPQGPRSGG